MAKSSFAGEAPPFLADDGERERVRALIAAALGGGGGGGGGGGDDDNDPTTLTLPRSLGYNVF